MKKFTFSVVASLAMSTLAIAGGNIEPVVEPVVETVVPAVKSGFYVGGAISAVQNDFRTYGVYNGEEDTYAVGNTDHLGGMLQVGYKFNQYLAVETRYWIAGEEDWSDPVNWGENSSFTTEFDAMGLYLKPMYPVMDGLDVYGLLGFALMNYDLTEYYNGEPDAHRNFSDTAFSYGVGASYAINDSLAVFVDYVRLYDDTIQVWYNGDVFADITSDTFNFGITYSF
ncbi:outer membrane protein [Sulfurovum sp. ST-21]|uniref:Outer membrane beta-barrel protein n=1 Tax=Sulfurovum indicum TaxID=2779528 RepID=A0A7M1S273_9BACT|nr:outer membrane beta-barrel protein [Sulfurovum indicum]QOR61314.1 outer membrane beta-barrel protein [Sulfurovum indicum]